MANSKSKSKLLVALAASITAFSSVASATDVYFSPNGGAEAAVVNAVNVAKKDIHVMTYQLTNKRIADALISAQARGVSVEVIVDRSQRKPAVSGSQYCCAYKVAQVTPMLLDARHPIHHNKVMVIDGSTVITGSFNFSNAAEKSNAENLLVINDVSLANKYLAAWNAHAAHSEKF